MEDDMGGGGSIFDMFSAGPSAAEEKKEEKEIKMIEINESQMVSFISDIYSNKGYAFLSLILAFEQKEV